MILCWFLARISDLTLTNYFRYYHHHNALHAIPDDRLWKYSNSLDHLLYISLCFASINSFFPQCISYIQPQVSTWSILHGLKKELDDEMYWIEMIEMHTRLYSFMMTRSNGSLVSNLFLDLWQFKPRQFCCQQSLIVVFECLLTDQVLRVIYLLISIDVC